MGGILTTILLDTHVVFWWKVASHRLTPRAATAVAEADELAVAAVTWYELAWLIENERLRVDTTARSWLKEAAVAVRSVDITPAIAATAASLPRAFPRDSADRLIYATAIEKGWQLVTRDERLRDYPHLRPITIW